MSASMPMAATGPWRDLEPDEVRGAVIVVNSSSR